MKRILFTLATLLSTTALADEQFNVTWRHLKQDHFVGRIRSLGWGTMGTAYDYNTPFTVEVHLCPVLFYGKDEAKPDWRDLDLGKTYHDSWNQEHNCRRLASTGQRTTRHGQQRDLNIALNFSRSDINNAIQSIRAPEWYRKIGDFKAQPVKGEIGYVLRIFIVNDNSILPSGVRSGSWVAMGTDKRVLANHTVTLPVGEVPVSPDGLQVNLEKGYDVLQRAGYKVTRWEQGQKFEEVSKTLGYLVEITAPPAQR